MTTAGTKVLLIGSGGREHALAMALAASPLVDEVIAAPGSAGIGQVARCVSVSVCDSEGLLKLAQEERVELVVIGPEDPLVSGLADLMRAEGFPTFGPGAAAARLEGSKAFAKEFMARHGVPTAEHATFDDLDVALAYVREGEGPLVVKADGLAAGKGVIMAEDRAQADRALRRLMSDRAFGTAGERVVIEEWMQGEEASVFALCAGSSFVLLPACQDHKRIGDGDTGANTGGMGAYSPAPVVTAAVLEQVRERIVAPVLLGLNHEGAPFHGVLYCGLMISPAGLARVVEFNVRFGDPETQVLLPRVRSDLYPWLLGAALGALPGDEADLEIDPRAALMVVLASAGYPETSTRGTQITGIDRASAAPDSLVFHAGTSRDDDGTWRTAGGRVLGVTALGADLAAARARAYESVRELCFDGMQMRRDIGVRGLGRTATA